MAQGLRQFAARPSWRPGARIFTGRGLRDAFGQRPCLTWAVTARGSAWESFAGLWRRGERWFWSREAALSATGPQSASRGLHCGHEGSPIVEPLRMRVLLGS